MMKAFSIGAVLLLSVSSVLASAEPSATSHVPKWTIEKIPDLMDRYGASGLAISAVSGDKIIFSQGFGKTASGDDYTSSSSCGLYSATKVFASLTYANLANDGRVSLDAPLDDLIDDAPDEWKSIPLFRLLNHTSGITMVINKEGFGDLVSNPETRNVDVYQMIKDAPLDYQPGEYSRYRQSGYAVGEMILRDRLGVSFDKLVSQYIAIPAGLSNTRHVSVENESEPAFLQSAGGYQTTANDIARLFLSINNATIISPEQWKALLLDERYLFDDYSLGSLIENREGILTLGHSGGGARANIRYAPDHKTGVMICTDDRQTNRLAIPLARMIMHEIVTGEKPAMPLFYALADFGSQSGEQIVAAYESAKGQADRFDLSESQSVLNRIGHFYLSDEKTDDAIDVFTLSTQEFPNSANAHDSLGKALLASGDSQGALIQYRRVQSLDPDNTNADLMIAKITNQVGEED